MRDDTKGKGATGAYERVGSWLTCMVCGNQFAPSRSSKIDPPQCADIVKHCAIQNQNRAQTVQRCVECNAMILDKHGNGRKVREDRGYCGEGCKKKAYRRRKEGSNDVNRMSTDILQEGVKT